MKSIFFLFALIAFAACTDKNSKPAGPDGWLKGNIDGKFDTIAAQLRGFDVAMVETGYRYQELFWAGKDHNWEYANYQLDKIKLAIEHGLQRRPKRAVSAEQFLSFLLPEMKKSVSQKDTSAFNHNFQLLTTGCNSCHEREKLPFFTVKIPVARQSPIR